jgi:pimeloyl-ACP methyl ester carboxylesterase
MEILLVSKTVLFILAIIVFLSLLQFFVSIHPPSYSDPSTPNNYGLTYENVEFTTSDNIKIRAWLIKSDKANGTVIVGHGYPFNKGNILPLATFLYPDYNLLYYDHRYFGESEGRVTTVGMKEVEDVKAAVSFIHKRFGSKEPIALFGFSLSAAAMLMSKEKVNAIISDSAYANLEQMTKDMYRIFGPLKYLIFL